MQVLLAWAAMYLKHHYLTDVLGGWAYAYLAMKIADFKVRQSEKTCRFNEERCDGGDGDQIVMPADVDRMLEKI